MDTEKDKESYREVIKRELLTNRKTDRYTDTDFYKEAMLPKRFREKVLD